MKAHVLLILVLGGALSGLLILDYKAKSVTPPPSANASPLQQPKQQLPTPSQPVEPKQPTPPPAPKKEMDKTADEVLAPFLKEAQDKNRLVLLFLSKDGCIPCSRLERTLDRNKDDLYKYYMVKAKDPRLNDKFKVTAFPTLVILDKTGKELNREVGYMGDSELKRFLQSVPAPVRDPAR